MPHFRTLLAAIAVLACLAGCSEQALIDKFTPAEEAAIAKDLVSKLAAKDFAFIEKQLDPSLQNPSTHTALEQAAAIIPPGAPKSITTVGVHTVKGDGATRYEMSFEYEFQDAWMMANVVLQRRDAQLTVLGLYVDRRAESLKTQNRFTFTGKSWLHYLVFALALLIPALIIYAFVLCARTPIARRKWVWMLFVAVGVVQLSLNWTSGAYTIRPLFLNLLGAGYTGGQFSPTVIGVAFPLGAIIFLWLRPALLAQAAALKTQAAPDAGHIEGA